MENNLSDANYSCETEGNDPHNKCIKQLSTENLDSEFSKNDHNGDYTTETTETVCRNHKDIAEKVEGVDDYISTITTRRLDKSLGGSDEDITDPENLVRDWEANHPHIPLSRRAGELALFAASLHLYEGRGITVSDLQRLGLEKDNAEIKLHLSKKNCLFIPHETLKIGKQKQYFLSNYKYIADANAKQNNKDTEINPDDDLLLQLIKILSCKKNEYHHIHLETSLNYKDDYKYINWDIPSAKNRQKVKTFNLEPRRKCSITVSPSGTVEIDIECTLHPYKLHTPSDLVVFFGACGQALSELQGAANNMVNIVPAIPEWNLTQLEYNKDIPISSKDPAVVSWAPVNGRLKIKYLGVIFQVYPKGLPEIGDCTRIEAQYNTKKKEKLVDTIADIIDGGKEGNRLPFVTAEDMFSKIREKKEAY